MRKLLYVPVIHSAADLGSLGPSIDRKSAALYGETRWAEHKETVSRFWQSVADYLLSLDVASLKVYQDGLAADGELGRRIVAEAARRGSDNHQFILQLLSKGAELRKTEDPSLLVTELKIAQEEAARGTSSDRLRSSTTRTHLTEERDRFVARTIEETLAPGETAVLFMGAYHDVSRFLAPDILVERLKEPDRLKAYFEELAHGRRDKRFQELAQYVGAPVVAPRP